MGTRTIFLNSKTYEVSGQVEDIATPEWANQLRLTGKPDPTARRDIATHNFGDVSYGVGKSTIRLNTENPRDIFRMEDSTCETRFPGQITLPGLVNTATQAADTGKIVATCEYLGSLRAVSLYVAGGNYTYFFLTYNSSTNKWDSTATIKTAAGGVTNYWAEMVVMDTYLLVYTESALYTSNNLGAFQTAALTGAPGSKTYCRLLPYGSTLYLAFHTGAGSNISLYSSTDYGTNVTSRVTIPSSNGCLGVATYYTKGGTLAPFFLTTDGLYLYDTTTNLAYRAINFISSQPSSGLYSFGDYLFISMKNGGILRVDANWSVVAVGLDLDNGIPIDRKGEVSALTACGAWLLCAVGGDNAASYASIFALDYKGWHHIYKHGTLNLQILSISVGSNNNGVDSIDRLHIIVSTAATTSTPYYIKYITQNPLNVTSFPFAASSYLTLSRFDGGLPDIPTGFYDLFAAADSLTADESVTVTYGLDNAAPTTSLGAAISTATQSMQFASGAGVTGKKIQVKVALARGATTTLTPILRDVSLHYLKTPTSRRKFRFSIDLLRMATDARSIETIIDELYTLLDSPLQVNFQLGNLFNGYVRVQNVQAIELVPETDDAGNSPQPLSRAGLAVTVGEMI